MVGHDHEEPTVTEGTVTETVTYNNASSQQVDGLTDVSQYCYQPIKYDCYNTHVSQKSLYQCFTKLLSANQI